MGEWEVGEHVTQRRVDLLRRGRAEVNLNIARIICTDDRELGELDMVDVRFLYGAEEFDCRRQIACVGGFFLCF